MTGTVEDKPILSGWVVEATAQSLDFIGDEASAFEDRFTYFVHHGDTRKG